MQQDTFLTLKQVLEITQVSRATLYRWIKAGDFPAQYLLTASGRSVRWKASQINQWYEKCVKKGGQ
ncbi:MULTISPECIES: helix-turn-helix transcriptional regulator [Morganellaceae]|uniref:helix-turn-helix transcriptional regulator n=1 Tax=Morganellaceae TaxID=1903414 RepID=UPI0008080568|nr:MULTISPECIES: AlpA family phage regulatory protein [Morganellaceae]MBS6209404.1 AlpA family phage regulatory protein [Proteus hauseri]AVB30193.1 AlpA family transcriptional regulator [Proteus mirabilis]EJD6080886.1 AlpA family phage regulatory protein [Providencia rettgeri]EJD6600246.1 AlpA family phage regulatory protein [Providencia rettgeri]ELR5137453.1 AlpA family phage regulatory protein [Providencia rettgeri]